MVRIMTIEDYEGVYALWKKIKGFGIRSIDDSKEGVARFLKRNPTTSVVAEKDGRIVGSILCGHDGRRGCLYHVCVDEDYRRHGIGKRMVVFAMKALKEEIPELILLDIMLPGKDGYTLLPELKKFGIPVIFLTAKADVTSKVKGLKREDLNYYDFTLNEENITAFNGQ